ncbi:MAG: hypothetical protein A3F33_01690 [Candidatus Woykebacteria bacterium RIFCSPHIGHO2_12_FULL_43_10]|uniref:cysteine desulfurase n=2 Tax=Candidatus Woykeibacteriota TaxID=1817899 RepID=A0A1G1WWA4_9BACT|nr:MAG: hypothetical protein A2802_02350 [Candidatus Woykebacteria bacterium RIFCSPHIGHO2_01_FULL_43_29]OGY29526.1 MAG: hypothetical protein A3F33_01690 [Candidatus Woykebacteria bacterium RIFCSPHIGHO2_12_FULL_43_10]OGY29625.1 MAG: hypothetical protein A3J50_00230 [Candidatus Woykebacteria bacterium RIFCSPHIGHO2_02_FULL_43_16b]OGY31640.1 MAG: hypothetical protein A3A61_00420 [Candidatus Woykebacteria bacterium RIFCSPLOWO2_01_FULL_43_14]
MFDNAEIRKDFPILKRLVNGYPLAYLDNAATSQKPEQVIKSLVNYYQNYNANIHRGVYTLSEEATKAYEDVRKKVKKFLNAGGDYEVIFTKNTTESINVVAWSYSSAYFKEGDEVLLTQMEHHSNIVPWFMSTQETRSKVVFASVTDEGILDLADFEKKLNPRTKFVSLTHVSNVLGTANPIKKVAALAHEKGIPVLIDGAQSVPHMRVNLSDLKPDFFAFSAHKMLGPLGVGVLVAKKDFLEKMEPVYGGGDMISEVTEAGAKWNVLPWKFEAGTPNVAGVIGLGTAIDYLEKVGLDSINEYEQSLVEYYITKLSKIDNLRILGPTEPDKRNSLVSFTLDGVHPHDLATILDQYGVAVRAGHHCAQPLHRRLGISASSRVSFYLYNTKDEIDRLVIGIEKAKEVFRV